MEWKGIFTLLIDYPTKDNQLLLECICFQINLYLVLE